MMVLQAAYSAAPPGGLPQVDTPDKKLPLRLKTSVLGQRYCKEPGSDVSDNLRLRLRLQYINVGQDQLILYKHDNTVFREMISHDPQEAMENRYIWDLSLMVITTNDEMINSQVPGTSFVLLPSGHSLEAETEVTIFAKRSSKGKESDGLPPGEYFLQVSVSTWPESAGFAEILRNRWQSFGTLWSSSITSEPMPFKIEGNRKVMNCSED
jgi:hypothetical protein